MRLNKFALTIAAASVTAILLATSIAVALAQGSPQSPANGPKQDPLAAVRAATGRFHSLTVAQASGYALLKDQAGIACIANPGVGAMGVHYVNGDLVNSGQVEALTPQ